MSDYYDLEKTAKVLSLAPAEVNSLREQGKLRAFRDGSNWKFRTSDVESFLAEKIKGRNKSAADEFVLADTAGKDILDAVSDAAMPGDSDLVEINASEDTSVVGILKENSAAVTLEKNTAAKNTAQKQPADADFDLAVTNNQDDVDLDSGSRGDEETSMLGLADDAPSEAASEVLFDDDPLPFQDDSSKLGLSQSSSPIMESSQHINSGKALDGSPDVDLADLSSGNAEPLGLAMESMLGNLQPDRQDFEVSGSLVLSEDHDSSDLLLHLNKEDSSALVFGGEFELQPSLSSPNDQSESSSQVIAVTADLGPGEFGDLGNFEFSSGEPSAIDSPFTSTFSESAGTTTLTRPAEYEYSNQSLIALAVAVVLLIVPGLMMADLIAGMWSWREPFALNSALMNWIAGMLGLV